MTSKKDIQVILFTIYLFPSGNTTEG